MATTTKRARAKRRRESGMMPQRTERISRLCPGGHAFESDKPRAYCAHCRYRRDRLAEWSLA